MNKRNKVDLNKVKKRHAIFSYFDPFGFYFMLKYAKTATIVVFTPHVPVYFWPNRHNVGDIELKFCIFP